MDLASVRAAVRRRWRMVSALFLLGPALAATLWVRTPMQYRASTTVIFALDGGTTVRDVVDGGTYVQQVVPSYAELARTPLVLQPVITQLKLSGTPQTLAEKVTVDVRSRSVLAQITAVSGTGQGAAALADGIADQLARTVRQVSQGSQRGSLPVVVRTVSPARVPGSPFAPNTVLLAGLGLAGGAGLAGLFLYLREAMAGTVRSREDVAEATDVPVLASIVHDPKGRFRPLAVDVQPHLPRAESFRMLRTNLMPALPEATRVLAVVSGESGEGRTLTAANLGIALANSGRRVLLIDADLHNPQLGQLFGSGPAAPGLTDVLTGLRTLDSVVWAWSPMKWDAQQVDVLPAGRFSGNPSELLGYTAMADLLGDVRSRYDLVILDTPAMLHSMDGAVVASQADASLVVVDAGRTERRALSEVLNRISMTVSVVGIVLNNAPESAPITGTRHTNRTTPTANGRRVAAAPGRFGRRAPQAVPDPNGSSPPSGKLDLADIRRQADAMRAPVRPSSGDGGG